MKKDGIKDRSFGQEKVENKTKLRSTRSNDNSMKNEALINSPKTRRRLIRTSKSQDVETKETNNETKKDCKTYNKTTENINNDKISEKVDKLKRKIDCVNSEKVGNITEDVDKKKIKTVEDETHNDVSSTGILNDADDMTPTLTEDIVKESLFDQLENIKEEIENSGFVSKSNQEDDITELTEEILPFEIVKTELEDVGEFNDSKVHEQSDDSEAITERRERRKAKSKYSTLDNDDLEHMLKWKNGVGELAGSNLKFRKSDIGALEVITPSSDEEDGNNVEDQDKKTRRKRGPRKQSESMSVDTTPSVSPKQKKLESPIDTEEKRRRKDRKKKKFADDELLKCETCGCYGLISEFRSSGRFCSQRCVGAYASKRRAEMIAQQFATGERPLPKTGRKPMKKRKSITKEIPTWNESSPYPNSRSGSPMAMHDSKITFKDDSNIYYEAVGRDLDFEWDTYLTVTGTEPVDDQVLIKEYPEQDVFPMNAASFKLAMKLECVDPKHQSHICVVSVVEVQGARMRLHFDGWSESYDYWINCDSPFLHPSGWCAKNGQTLTPPRGITPQSFDWSKYLGDTGCEAAPEHLFPKLSPTLHGFMTNMKLEAVDRKNPDLICVASVNNVIGNHFLIHFDEWDDQYDYWCKDDSPFIHPVGWCQEKQVPLVPPTDEMVNRFVWTDYLNDTNTIAAPTNIFQQIYRYDFQVGLKLEVIDPRNPSLCRVATVCDAEDYRVKIHFDGWNEIYDYWFDYDSTDLHPVNWCKKTGHVLEPPPVGKEFEESRLCGTAGCRGIGHIKGLKYTTHHTSFGCPYTLSNINRSTSPVVDRLAPNAINEETSISNRIYKKKYGSPTANDVLPDSTTKDDTKKPKQRMAGRPSKNSPGSNKKSGTKGGIKKRRRRRSDEVSSSTSPSSNINILHSNSYLTKPIPPTHRPAGQSNMIYQQQNKVILSKAVPWSADDVVDFLKCIGYEDLAPCFKDNQIDGQALLLLSQADLVHHLKLKLGPALKIYSEISKL